MSTVDLLREQSFSLRYQNCGIGPDGLVVLPEGDYYLTQVEDGSYVGPVWVSVKQESWKEPVKIRLSDFIKFQEYNHYV